MTNATHLSKRPTVQAKTVSVYDADQLAWHAVGKEGLALKPAREDKQKGTFLGLVGFEPMTRSGLHQHLGVATSFILDGSITDYQGPIALHHAGINLPGATHDATTYQRTLLMSRLEAGVIYPEATDRNYALHVGPRFGAIRNPAPEIPPEINVQVDALPALATSVGGTTRKMLFDFALAGGKHRYVELSMIPGSKSPAFTTNAVLELWVRGGDLRIGGKPAWANCFAIVEPGTTITLESDFGALFHAWSEGPIDWADGAARPDLFGF